jgi:hypothetical protein
MARCVACGQGMDEAERAHKLSKHLQVRKPPSRPRGWANFSLLQLYSHGNAWANLHLLGQPNSLLARSPRRSRRSRRSG